MEGTPDRAGVVFPAEGRLAPERADLARARRGYNEVVARPGKGTGGEVKEKPKAVTKRPQLFHVVLINDDYTTMEFVVHVLESVFDKGPAEAYRIMMEVHIQGRGVCGAYTYEVAETKVETVHEMARTEGFPLRAGIEEA